MTKSVEITKEIRKLTDEQKLDVINTIFKELMESAKVKIRTLTAFRKNEVSQDDLKNVTKMLQNFEKSINSHKM